MFVNVVQRGTYWILCCWKGNQEKKDLIARINDSNSWWLQVIFLKSCILDVINDLVFKRFKHSIKCVIFFKHFGFKITNDIEDGEVKLT